MPRAKAPFAVGDVVTPKSAKGECYHFGYDHGTSYVVRKLTSPYKPLPNASPAALAYRGPWSGWLMQISSANEPWKANSAVPCRWFKVVP